MSYSTDFHNNPVSMSGCTHTESTGKAEDIAFLTFFSGSVKVKINKKSIKLKVISYIEIKTLAFVIVDLTPTHYAIGTSIITNAPPIKDLTNSLFYPNSLLTSSVTNNLFNVNREDVSSPSEVF